MYISFYLYKKIRYFHYFISLYKMSNIKKLTKGKLFAFYKILTTNTIFRSFLKYVINELKRIIVFYILSKTLSLIIITVFLKNFIYIYNINQQNQQHTLRKHKKHIQYFIENNLWQKITKFISYFNYFNLLVS